MQLSHTFIRSVTRDMLIKNALKRYKTVHVREEIMKYRIIYFLYLIILLFNHITVFIHFEFCHNFHIFSIFFSKQILIQTHFNF